MDQDTDREMTLTERIQHLGEILSATTAKDVERLQSAYETIGALFTLAFDDRANRGNPDEQPVEDTD